MQVWRLGGYQAYSNYFSGECINYSKYWAHHRINWAHWHTTASTGHTTASTLQKPHWDIIAASIFNIAPTNYSSGLLVCVHMCVTIDHLHDPYHDHLKTDPITEQFKTFSSFLWLIFPFSNQLVGGETLCDTHS